MPFPVGCLLPIPNERRGAVLADAGLLFHAELEDQLEGGGVAVVLGCWVAGSFLLGALGRWKRGGVWWVRPVLRDPWERRL